MGYFLSALVKFQNIGLLGTGFSLAWGIVLSGDAPSLDDVYSDSVYLPTRWLWSVSAPRWAIEALYLKELEARPFAEIQADDLGNTYHTTDYRMCIQNAFLIGLGWNLLAFIMLKLKDRDKQK